jgi:CheY-like chemotaxis protein
VRLVAVTGYGQKADVDESRAAGFDHHLVKPVSTEVLIDAIRAGFVA